jgi:hypothetical protein
MNPYTTLFVGAVVSAVVLVAVQSLWSYLCGINPPAAWDGLWVSDRGNAALDIHGRKWNAHLGVEGFVLTPRSVDPRRGTANGDVTCAVGGQRVGSFTLRRNPIQGNELALEVLREGQAASGHLCLKRPV